MIVTSTEERKAGKGARYKMDAHEYLSQAYRLEQRIQIRMEELKNLRALAEDVGSPGFEEHYNPNHPTEASFTKTLERIWEKEQEVNEELNDLIRLRGEIQQTINQVEDVDERLILTYRYLKNCSWNQISDKLCVSDRTIRRWYNNALSHVEVPPRSLEKYQNK